VGVLPRVRVGSAVSGLEDVIERALAEGVIDGDSEVLRLARAVEAHYAVTDEDSKPKMVRLGQVWLGEWGEPSRAIATSLPRSPMSVRAASPSSWLSARA